jgi:hypothetical protein
MLPLWYDTSMEEIDIADLLLIAEAATAFPQTS